MGIGKLQTHHFFEACRLSTADFDAVYSHAGKELTFLRMGFVIS